MQFISPNWPAPKHIHAMTTTRIGGVSLAPYHSLNLGEHVGDKAHSVCENRQRLNQQLRAQSRQVHEPIWLEQTHSTDVLNINPQTLSVLSQPYPADGSYTELANQVCTVMTADCLPVLFCSKAGDEVAAAHAGWRGLCDGILEQTVSHFRCSPEQILVWLGPAIGPDKFEVGVEVKQLFEQYDKQSSHAFKPHSTVDQKYFANIYLLAKQRLEKLGIKAIYGGQYCTVTDEEQFFSYRRDKVTGRMASLIWFE